MPTLPQTSTAEKRASGSGNLLALSCFFLSGATGLVYEVVWTRLMGGTIGNTHFSITLVVSVFMGGLALGSYLGGKLADRSSNPLRLYGILTLLVGGSCLLVPVAVRGARPLFGWLYSFYDGTPEAPFLLSVRIAFSALVLLVPTSFMGATLPALSRHFTRKLSEVGGTVGRLYALNTLGAVVGAFATGFLGIRFIGIWGSILLAVAIDAAIGFAVFWASGKVSAAEPAPSAPSTPEVALRRSTPLPLEARLAMLAFAVVGFADMLLQIAWTKAIVLCIGNSTYAFSLIVTLFILGIAVGGGIVSIFVDRLRNPLLVLGCLIFGTAALVSATIPLLGYFPVTAARLFDQIEEPSYGRFLLEQVRLVSMAILPSTILMGTVFPLVGRLTTRSLETVGSAIGSAYFWNTLGSILGTLAAGFLFIPLFGKVYYTLYLGAGLSLAMGLLLLFQALRLPAALRAVTVATLCGLVLLPNYSFRPHGVLGSENNLWHPSILSRGAYAYFHGAYYDSSHRARREEDFVRQLIEENHIVLYQEGIHAPVAVVKNPHGEMAMRISGKVEASLAPGGGYNNDLPHQVMAGHLPMVLHPDPKNVLTLGLGGGVTLGTLTLYPVESIDSLEISPEVIQAARDYFSSANRGALANPKVRSIVGDGRNHLEYTRRKYDVITSVPSNPWIAGIGNLFTVEFFQACRRRLNDGGLISNWIHKINMRAEDFRSVVRTFIDVFGDHAQLWDLGYDCLLIGSAAPVRFDSERFQHLLENAEIARDFANLGIKGPETFFRYFLFDAVAMRHYAGESAPLNTDSFPVLEFSCPYGLYGHAFDTFDSLAAADASGLSPAWISGMGSSLERAMSIQGSFRRYQRAESRYEELRKEISRVPEEAGPDLRRQRELVRSALDILDDFKVIEQNTREGRDDWLQDRANGMAANALGVTRGPTLRSTLCSAFLLYAQKRQGTEEKMAHLEEAARYAGEDAKSTIEFAMECLSLKHPEKAMGPVQSLLQKAPQSPQLLQTLGALQAASGQLEAALLSFSKALQAAQEPELRSRVHQDTALALQLAQRPLDALAEYEKALKENPANETARARLAQLQGQIGAQLQQGQGAEK